MKLTIKLYANLRKYSKGEGTIVIELPEECQVKDVLRHLMIPDKETKIIMVNGVQVQLDSEVHDGDRVAFFPPIAGG